MLQRCVKLKIVVANRLLLNHLKRSFIFSVYYQPKQLQLQLLFTIGLMKISVYDETFHRIFYRPCYGFRRHLDE